MVMLLEDICLELKIKIYYLKEIGTSEVVLREEFLKDSSKALLKPRFAGVIDTTGIVTGKQIGRAHV